MKIRNVGATIIKMPLIEPYSFSKSSIPAAVSLLVSVELDGGIMGYGEACMPGTPFCPEPIEMGKAAVESHFGPALLGETIYGIDRLMKKVEEASGAFTFTKAAVDIALHDALARVYGVSVAQLLGGPIRTTKEIVGWIGLVPADETVRKAIAFVERGFTTLKMKIGSTIQEDVARVKAVRDAVGNGPELRLDPNGKYSFPDALRLLVALEPFNIQYIEDPLDEPELSATRDLRIRSRVPICVDDPIRSPRDATKVLAAGCADVIKIKLVRAGGFINARKILGIAESFGIPVVVGMGLGGDLETAAELQLCCGCQHVWGAGDMTGSSKLASHLVDKPLLAETNHLQLPTGPGLGLVPNAEAVSRHEYR